MFHGVNFRLFFSLLVSSGHAPKWKQFPVVQKCKTNFFDAITFKKRISEEIGEVVNLDSHFQN